jgi:hypothetical protein
LQEVAHLSIKQRAIFIRAQHPVMLYKQARIVKKKINIKMDGGTRKITETRPSTKEF